MKSMIRLSVLSNFTKSTVFFFVALALFASSTRAGMYKEIADFSIGGKNPTGLRMFLYIPTNLKTNPAVLVGIHWCHGTDSLYYIYTKYRALADQYGFLVIYPNANSSDSCFDVHSTGTLSHDSTGDARGIVSMVKYVIKTYQADSTRVFATGHSSGGMMTIVLMGSYPDVFKAGSASADVPFGCFAGTNTWSDACANGQITKSAKEWGDLVRAAYPGYTGSRPRIQLWHGANDVTLNYKNFDEDIKQWVDVLGLNQTPVTSQFTLRINGTNYSYSRSLYANNLNVVMLDAIKALNQDHNCQISEDSVVVFFGLDKTVSTIDGAMKNINRFAGTSLAIEKSSSGIFHFIVSSQPGRVNIDLFDLSGAKIQTIADRNSPTGLLRFSWDAIGKNNRALPPAVYILSINVNGVMTGCQSALFAGR